MLYCNYKSEQSPTCTKPCSDGCSTHTGPLTGRTIPIENPNCTEIIGEPLDHQSIISQTWCSLHHAAMQLEFYQLERRPADLPYQSFRHTIPKNPLVHVCTAMRKRSSPSNKNHAGFVLANNTLINDDVPVHRYNKMENAFIYQRHVLQELIYDLNFWVRSVKNKHGVASRYAGNIHHYTKNVSV